MDQALEEGADLGAGRRVARAQEHRHRLATLHMVDVVRRGKHQSTSLIRFAIIWIVRARRMGPATAKKQMVEEERARGRGPYEEEKPTPVSLLSRHGNLKENHNA